MTVSYIFVKNVICQTKTACGYKNGAVKSSRIISTVVWKTFDVKNTSYESLVTKLKHTNIILLQNFSHEIY